MCIRDRHHPNLEAYTALIDGYGKAGMLHKALGPLKVMQARDVEPNEYSYPCLVGAMARCGKSEQANKLLAVMESDGVMPTTVTYNAFMAGILEGAPPPDESPSEEWAASGSGEFESEEQKLYNERVVDSLRLFTKMVKAKVSPNAITVSTIVESLGRCNPPRISEARSIADLLEQAADQLKPDVIRAARVDEGGRRDLDRIEYALGTIGKALILTDYSIDQEKDMDKLKAFRDSQRNN